MLPLLIALLMASKGHAKDHPGPSVCVWEGDNCWCSAPSSRPWNQFSVAADLLFQTRLGCHSVSCLRFGMVNSHGKLEVAEVNITVVVGAKSFSDKNLERKQVQKIILHKDYKSTHLDSDLCLLLLTTPVQFTNVKMPICLPQKESRWDRCWMAEWASTHGYGPTKDLNMQLKKLRVIQISRRACIRRVTQLSRNMLCAWKEPDTNGRCQGDSGAPMVCGNWGTRRLFQVGVFSWGMSSGSRGRPGMFVSVARFVPWILEETQKEGRALTLSEASRSPLTCVPQYPILLSLGSQMLLAAMFAGDKSQC